jgi:hypothetical protein
MEEIRNAYRTLAQKPPGRTSHEKYTCRCEEAVIMDYEEQNMIQWTGLNWLTIGTNGVYL